MQATNGRRNIMIPESTPVPNFFFDVLMPIAPRAFFDVLLFIWRKTVGWDKERDFLSLSQIQKGASVSRGIAVDAIRFWKSAGLVIRGDRHGLRGTIEYRVLLDYDREAVTGSITELVQNPNWFSKWYSTGSVNGTPLVKLLDTQKALNKNHLEEKQSSSVSEGQKPKRGLGSKDFSLHRQCFDYAYESFKRIFGQAPTWRGKDHKQEAGPHPRGIQAPVGPVHPGPRRLCAKAGIFTVVLLLAV
jgi:hypothetical protein